jgi:hypothetical protein
VQNSLRVNVDVYEGGGGFGGSQISSFLGTATPGTTRFALPDRAPVGFFARRERDFTGYAAPDVTFRVVCDR